MVEKLIIKLEQLKKFNKQLEKINKQINRENKKINFSSLDFCDMRKLLEYQDLLDDGDNYEQIYIMKKLLTKRVSNRILKKLSIDLDNININIKMNDCGGYLDYLDIVINLSNFVKIDYYFSSEYKLYAVLCLDFYKEDIPKIKWSYDDYRIDITYFLETDEFKKLHDYYNDREYGYLTYVLKIIFGKYLGKFYSYDTDWASYPMYFRK